MCLTSHNSIIEAKLRLVCGNEYLIDYLYNVFMLKKVNVFCDPILYKYSDRNLTLKKLQIALHCL